VVNHTSIVDLFITLRLMPGSTVGIVKKEVILYPFFGQMYLLTGHLRVDRGKRAAAVASMKKLSELVRKHKLSIIMSPEGTRSRDGRLLPFKKGLIHMALQTGLPVVPMVIHGAHQAWRSDSLAVRSSNIFIDVLPAVDTSHWSADDTDAAVEEIHAIFRANLPPEQRPLITD
jgi:lysophosphatidate acyltransferase